MLIGRLYRGWAKMKLHNKKTDEPLLKLNVEPTTDEQIIVMLRQEVAYLNGKVCVLEELIEKKDCKKLEPLIKDEKIRKAVKAWADALDIEYVDITHDGSNCVVESVFCGLSIEFDETAIDQKDGHYTIEELCGVDDE